MRMRIPDGTLTAGFPRPGQTLLQDVLGLRHKTCIFTCSTNPVWKPMVSPAATLAVLIVDHEVDAPRPQRMSGESGSRFGALRARLGSSVIAVLGFTWLRNVSSDTGRYEDMSYRMYSQVSVSCPSRISRPKMSVRVSCSSRVSRGRYVKRTMGVRGWKEAEA